MCLKDCLDIGKNCRLDTVGEAVYNIHLHAPSLFDYDKLWNELNELDSEVKTLGEIEGISIPDMLNKLNK